MSQVPGRGEAGASLPGEALRPGTLHNTGPLREKD